MLINTGIPYPGIPKGIPVSRYPGIPGMRYQNAASELPPLEVVVGYQPGPALAGSYVSEVTLIITEYIGPTISN